MREQDKMSLRMADIDFVSTVHNEAWFRDRLEDCTKEFLEEMDPQMLWSICVHKNVHLAAVKEAGGKDLPTEPHAFMAFLGVLRQKSENLL